MSSRGFRKLYGQNVLPPPEDSDGDDDMFFSQPHSTNKFIGLELPSNSEHESTEPLPNDDVDTQKSDKKKKRKKKKNSFNARKESNSDVVVDEIEKALLELNSKFTDLPCTSKTEENLSPVPKIKEIFWVQNKFLNMMNEQRRIFGPSAAESSRPKPSQRLINFKKTTIVSIDKHKAKFRRHGLTMSLDKQENGLSYFIFNHSPDYQIWFSKFLKLLQRQFNILSLETVHIEVALEQANEMAGLENYPETFDLIEYSIAYMQYISHPLFNLSNINVRLDYTIAENRIFHIAILKYLHLLANKACHRTGLELAKMLLNIDPSDPLAVIFIIDTLALRAREHSWLTQAVDEWMETRNANRLCNIQYSYALAHFHVQKKNKGDLTRANELLQNAIINFPSVFTQILQYAKIKLDPKLKEHDIFNKYAEKSVSEALKFVILMYATFTWEKWREPKVIDWFIDNAKKLVDKYDSDSTVKERVENACKERSNLFQKLPDEVKRHLIILQPFFPLLFDHGKELPRVVSMDLYDPIPPANGINRYNYDYSTQPSDSNWNAMNFFFYMLPQYRYHQNEDDGDDGLQLREIRRNIEIVPDMILDDDDVAQNVNDNPDNNPY